ncbi:MAG: hypothetical protein RQ754_04385 [Desulfuromonadales bacterium]|nr:hypothetical protein [Desulfuromonadales bacterium]
MKKLIRNTFISLLCATTTAPVAYAAASTSDDGSSLLAVLFVGFFALIVVFQLVPAILLFVGLLKGLLFHEDTRKEEKVTYK